MASPHSSIGDLPEMVLSAIAHYQLNYEQLRVDVEKWVAKLGARLDDAQLRDTLETLIAAGHVQPYELSTEPPHERKVPYAPARLGELWYRASTTGLGLLKRLEEDGPKPWWPE